MPNADVIIAKERRKLMDLKSQKPFNVPSCKLNENLVIATWNIQ